MNAPSYFEIHVVDLERAIGFYRSVFGWTFTRAEGLPIEVLADRDQRPARRAAAASGSRTEPGTGNQRVYLFDGSQ